MARACVTTGGVTIDLANYEDRAREAVQLFWTARERARQRQSESERSDTGERAAVTAGKNMEGFATLTTEIMLANGFERDDIHTERRMLTLPGWFRPTKLWDVIAVREGRPVAAIEFKSQVGPSFGNNYNNRVEEAIGLAHDFQTAYRRGVFGEKIPPPFLGWMLLLEDADGSREPVTGRSSHIPMLEEFDGVSYAERYEILCRKLVEEGLYTAAAVVLSPRSAASSGEYSELSESTGLRNFLHRLATRVGAETTEKTTDRSQLV